MNNLNDEYLNKLIETSISLAYLGIESEEPYCQYDKFGFTECMIYKFTVPEKSTISEIIDGYKSDDIEDLKKYTKESVLKIIQLDLDDEEKDEVVDFIKFYAKVRPGDIWTEEKGKRAVEEIKEALSDVVEWKKV